MRTLRAVSPVVATALLVLIAVATAVILYLWVSGTVANQPTQQQVLREELKIDTASVYYNTSDSNYYFDIYVRNVGSAVANITNIYILDANTGLVIFQNTTKNIFGEWIILVPGNYTELKHTFTPKITVPYGNPVIVKLTTRDGVEVQYVTTLVKK